MLDGPETKGELLSHLNEERLNRLTEDLSVEVMVGILEAMPTDDAADVMGRLPEERAAEILKARMGSKSVVPVSTNPFIRAMGVAIIKSPGRE